MSETVPLKFAENGLENVKLERDDLGFDYVFLRLPQVSGKQIAWFLLVNYCWIVAGMVQVGSVILQAIPDYRCRAPADELFPDVIDYEKGLEFTPEDSCMQYANVDSICQDLTDDFVNCFKDEKPNLKTESCDAGYIFDNSTFTRTVSTEYELVCENKELDSAISAIFMSGLFFGVFIFGPLMDKIGRRLAALIAMMGISAVSLPLVLIPYHENGMWTYAALRFLSGFFAISAGTASFVFTMEIVGPKYRTWFGSLTQGIFSVGYMLLSLIGYLLADWQDQMIVILIAPLLYIPIYLYLPTSIAWLFSSRKFDQARSETAKIAKCLKVDNCTEDFLDELEASVKLQQKVAMEKSTRK
ncbi:Oidioi.mRNA.OKI2018_I69.chr2.g4999.t1.cds [Oikopleura dioica]|uniref:Oidioi.mRNA.OKI2018_I69.chr2.g4999.t1.cds n=1 Tax=Oikopleura dioica TaxID=34765 RepID=A0ABN7T3E8_OIKDI|nr:Oidioi.mRNA.OKI2018_I69.chr2.g4999.t1.cds [Oikopleura dioica]